VTYDLTSLYAANGDAAAGEPGMVERGVDSPSILSSSQELEKRGEWDSNSHAFVEGLYVTANI
jgi:hypothetical protein